MNIGDFKMTVNTNVKNDFQSLSFGWNYIKSLRSSRYRLSSMIGEHIDNSCDEEATVCKIDFSGKSNKYEKIVISDNGNGMSWQTLHDSFKLGLARNNRKKNSNGKFGLGGTTSALALAARKLVITRHSSGMYAREYNLEDVQENDCWGTTPVHVTDELVAFFNKYVGENSTGTVIILSNLDRINSKRIDNAKAQALKYLGRTYCSFLESGKLKLFVSGKEVRPDDPLMWWDERVEKLLDIPIPGTKSSRLRVVDVSKATINKYNKLHKSGGYIYRENRLVKHGIFKSESWPNLYEKAQNKRDLRWAVHFSCEDDALWNIANSKDDVLPSENLESWVGNKIMPIARQLADLRDKRDKKISEEEKSKIIEQDEELINQTAKEEAALVPNEKNDKDSSSKGESKDINRQPTFDTKKSVFSIIDRDLHYTGPLAYTEKADPNENYEFGLVINSAHPFIIKYFNNGSEETREAISTLIHSYLMSETIVGHEKEDIRRLHEKFNSNVRELTIRKDQR
jgi:hypothetical protein